MIRALFIRGVIDRVRAEVPEVDRHRLESALRRHMPGKLDAALIEAELDSIYGPPQGDYG